MTDDDVTDNPCSDPVLQQGYYAPTGHEVGPPKSALIAESVVGAVRWRDIASGLAGALEEVLTWDTKGEVPDHVTRVLEEFYAASEDDDPERTDEP